MDSRRAGFSTFPLPRRYLNKCSSDSNARLAPAGRDKYRLCCAGQQEEDLDLTV